MSGVDKRKRLTVLLNGVWKFRGDRGRLGEEFPERVQAALRHETRFMDLDHDDGDWEEVCIPACWAEHGFNGPVGWYRRWFDAPELEGKRCLLCFSGVDYFCDVWVNQRYVGCHEGYFDSFVIDITEYITRGRNLICVRVEAPQEKESLKLSEHCRKKRWIRGSIQDWDCVDLDIDPGGIWGDVSLEIVNTCYIENFWALPYLELTPHGHAQGFVTAHITIRNAGVKHYNAQLLVMLTPFNSDRTAISVREQLSVPPGSITRSVVLKVENPELWWVRGFGPQSLYELSATLSVEGEIDEQWLRTGFRRVDIREGHGLLLNGKQLFLRGVNYVSEQLLSRVSDTRYQEDLKLITEMNANAIRVFAHVEKPSFYNFCDEYGILVYQDFPLQWQYVNDTELVERAKVQTCRMIRGLAHHPSIYEWNFGSEPSKDNFLKLCAGLAKLGRELDPTRKVSQGNYIDKLWGKEIDLFAWSKEHKWEIDNHMYQGWYGERWGPMENLHKIDPLLMPVVSEYGAQALPNVESVKRILADKCWPPNWTLFGRKCFQRKEAFLWIPEPRSLEEFVRTSQEYQARLLKYHTEFYRCRKFRPTYAIFQFFFRDCSPAITWSVVDYFGEKKLGYEALKHAFSPILIMVDNPVTVIQTSDVFKRKVFVVNDTLTSFTNLQWGWRLETENGDPIAQSEGTPFDLPANSLVEVGEIECVLVVRREVKGRVRLVVFLESDKGTLSQNTYDYEVQG